MNGKKGIYIVVTSMGNMRAELMGFLMRIVNNPKYRIIRDWVAGKPSEDARCRAITKFLDNKLLGDWLFFIDSDVCPPDNILDLVDIAEERGIKIISGLYHSFQFNMPFPLAFELTEDGEAYRVRNPLPENSLVEVDATGAGCLFIHREVLEKFRENNIYPFHREYDKDGTVYRGEDIYFCRRAKELGYKIYVHTGYIAHHYKTVDLVEVNNLLVREQMRWMAKYEPKNYWNRIWSVEDDRFYPELYPEVIRFVPPTASVLDIGCGTGTLLYELKNKGCKCYGVDISEVAIKKLKARGIEGEVCDVENEDIKIKEKFDYVLAIELLEHLNNPEILLQKMKKLAKKYCIIAVPDNILPPDEFPEHKHIFDEEKFRNLLSKYFDNIIIKKKQDKLLAICSL